MVTENHFINEPVDPTERHHAKEDLTCYDCDEHTRENCPYVDDWYNLDGDCLALK